MEVYVNRQVLNALLVDHGADKERTEKLDIEIIEEPHLVPKDRNLIIRALKRVVAFFQFTLLTDTLGRYIPPPSRETVLIYKTRIELSLYGIDTILAHECGHFFDHNPRKEPPIEGITARMVDPFEGLDEDLHKERTAEESARVLMEDPRWKQVISSDS